MAWAPSLPIRLRRGWQAVVAAKRHAFHGSADLQACAPAKRPAAHVAALLTTFPDFSMKIEDIIAEGNKVVTRVTGKGTHAGTWMQIEPTGSVIQMKGINIDRVSNGRIVEHWGEADTVGMLVQMGVDPFVGRSS
jgi:predicted ester cyclase